MKLMSDEPNHASTGADQPDFSGLDAPLARKRWHSGGSPRPLRGLQRSVWFPVLVIVAVSQLNTGLAFVVLPPVMVQEWTWIIAPFMCIYSIVPAQFCLLHLPLVLAAEPWRRRFSAYWTTTIAILSGWYLMLFAGCLIAARIKAGEPEIVKAFTEIAFWLPSFLLTLQLPLWAIRFLGKRKLQNPRVGDEHLTTSRSDPPSSRIGWLTIIALVGLTAGGYYSLWSLNPPTAYPSYVEQTIAMWFRTIGISLAIIPPTLWWLTSRELSYLFAWLATALYAATIIAAACYTLAALGHFHFTGGGVEIVDTMTFGFVTTYTAGLQLLRTYGWRLVKERDQVATSDRSV